MVEPSCRVETRPVIGGGGGFFDSAKEKDKAQAVVGIYRILLKRERYCGLHPFDTTKTKKKEALLAKPPCAALRGSSRLPLRLSLVERRAPTPLLTATWRALRTRGAHLAGTSTAVPRPSCKLEAGHHRGEVGKSAKSVGLREPAGRFDAAKGERHRRREAHGLVIARQGTVDGRWLGRDARRR